jgi:hypothetical protein
LAQDEESGTLAFFLIRASIGYRRRDLRRHQVQEAAIQFVELQMRADTSDQETGELKRNVRADRYHDLTRCAEDIMLAREAHFPATIAELYNSDGMPADLRQAHDRNDEVLERIYIGRRFRNDTERLEKLFELYTKMTAGRETGKKRQLGAGA